MGVYPPSPPCPPPPAPRLHTGFEKRGIPRLVALITARRYSSVFPCPVRANASRAQSHQGHANSIFLISPQRLPRAAFVFAHVAKATIKISCSSWCLVFLTRFCLSFGWQIRIVRSLLRSSTNVVRKKKTRSTHTIQGTGIRFRAGQQQVCTVSLFVIVRKIVFSFRRHSSRYGLHNHSTIEMDQNRGVVVKIIRHVCIGVWVRPEFFLTRITMSFVGKDATCIRPANPHRTNASESGVLGIHAWP